MGDTDLETVLGIMIPLSAIVLGLSIPIVNTILDYRKKRRLIETHHAERMAAIERGMDLPPLPAEILGGGRRRPQSTLLPGLIWFFVGLALTALPFRSSDFDIALVGLIPTGVGVAYLIYYFAEGRKLERGANGERGT